MKKLVSFFLCLVILTAYLNPVSAQLSGTKVIGTAPSDYSTFSSAVSALNSQGVNGNVVFQVKPGTYTERISLNQISGAGANKTVTFTSQSGDSTSVILQYASLATATNNYVIQLNGADYITFKNMTIRRTDSLNYSVVIDIKSGARRNFFINNIIEGNTKPSSSTFKALVTSDNIGKDGYNTFNNNIFRNGDFGIYFLGQGSTQPDSGNAVLNNKFIDQAYRSLYFTSQLWLTVKGNLITSNSQNANFYGIYTQYANDTMRIVKNNIALATGVGIYLANCNETSTGRGLIANNFVSIGGASTANGIYIVQSKNQDVYYNSVNIFSTHTTSGVALNLSGSSTEYITVKNNALVNTGGGFAYFVTATAPSTCIMASDYNDLFTTGVYIGSWKSNGNITTFANWKAVSGLESHSFNVNPAYTSSTDLHAHNPLIKGKATPYILPVVINDDIDGNIRSTSAPDIGADEFSLEDVGISKVILTTAGYCPGTVFNVKVRIRNYGLSALSGAIPVYYKIGSSSVVNATTTNLNIPAGDSVLYTFSNTESIAVAGSYQVHAGTSYATDLNYTNDTCNATLTIVAPPDPNLGPDKQVCTGHSITLTASGGGSYVWNVAPPNTTASITVTPSTATTYMVTVTSVQGCTNTGQVMVTPVTLPPVAASFTYLPNGLQLQFTGNSVNATHYHWAFGDGDTSGVQNPVHTYASAGNYTVKLIAWNVCDADTTQQMINLTGIAENSAQPEIIISPNPASDVLYVTHADEMRYEIIGLQSTVLQNGTITDGSIDITRLSRGLYFIKLTGGQGIYCGKFIKE